MSGNLSAAHQGEIYMSRIIGKIFRKNNPKQPKPEVLPYISLDTYILATPRRISNLKPFGTIRYDDDEVVNIDIILKSEKTTGIYEGKYLWKISVYGNLPVKVALQAMTMMRDEILQKKPKVVKSGKSNKGQKHPK